MVVLLIYLYTFHLLWFLEMLSALGCCPCVSLMHSAVLFYWLPSVNEEENREVIVLIVIF